MKKNTRWLFAIVIALSLVAAACSDSDDASGDTTAATTAAPTTAAPTTAAPTTAAPAPTDAPTTTEEPAPRPRQDWLDLFDANGDGTLTIGVAAAGPRDDNGYYQSLVNFAETFSAENNFDPPIVSDEITPDEAAQRMADLAQQGIDILFVGASEIAEPLGDLTEQFPDIFWYCNCGAGFPALPGLAQGTDAGAEIHWTAGVAMGATLQDTGGTSAVMIGGSGENFEVEAFEATLAGMQSVDESFTIEYVASGDFPFDFDNCANATAAVTNAKANGASLVYPYLGGALECTGQTALDEGMAVFAAAPGDACTRTDGIEWTGTIVFDGGRYTEQSLGFILDGELGEGSTFRFPTLPGLNGAELCGGSAEANALVAQAFEDIATDGELLDRLGAISGAAYGG